MHWRVTILTQSIIEHLLRTVLIHAVMHDGALLATSLPKDLLHAFDLAFWFGLGEVASTDDWLVMRCIIDRVGLLIVLICASLARM